MPTLGTFGAASARGFGLTTAGRLVANITIASNTSNYTLNTAKVTGYKAGATDVIFTINSGVFISSTSTGSYALTVDTSWTTGDTITVVNNGTIVGKGGQGGPGGGTSCSASTFAASGGGPALLIQRATSINNLNRIAGGGGGGGGAGYKFVGKSTAGGGGGGGGIGNGEAGIGGVCPAFGIPAGGSGSAGSLTSAGSGGSTGGGSPGGAGGTYGSSGSNGPANNSNNGGAGGAGGAAVVGNSNITWIAFGTRNGSIS
jgi:hypothetical protein